MSSVRSVKKIAHPDFARRMDQACDGNTDVPLPNYGRLGWFVAEFEKRGKEVTQETIRKWFHGETRPRHNMLVMLAEILKVDQAWLAVGSAPELSEKQMRVRNAAADGAVNVLAGFITMCGGHPAFPVEGDDRAAKNKIDLYAIIRGAQYAFHVVTETDGKFSVPTEAREALVIGVRRTGDLSVDFFELDWDQIETGKRKGGMIEAVGDWKQIKTFSERL